jgi:uncharacterized protein YjiS (DUF1127 family)
MKDRDMSLPELLRLWRARHHHRQELTTMSAGDLKDARASSDLVAREIRKWPWQPFPKQWEGLDAALLRGIKARHSQRERRPRLPRRAVWHPMRTRHVALATTVMIASLATLSALLAYLR